jgi:hypothetical protein
MANLLLLCGRDGAAASYSTATLEAVADRLIPDNAPAETTVVRDDDLALVVAGNAEPVTMRDGAVCMGGMIDPPPDWHDPGGSVPDGTFALARTDDSRVELLSDAVGSRSLFYRQFDDCFVAATSQRAIAHFGDRVVPDEEAVAWMVSSGTLGPPATWDRRVELLPPDARLEQDRSAWTLTVDSRPLTVAPEPSPESHHRDRLADAIERSSTGLDLDPADWRLPLSGGLDSRELLLQFRDHRGLEAITWGTADALAASRSDADCARRLAGAVDVDHSYHELPAVPDDVEIVFDRFLTAGEGRVDHVAGYVDGFETYATLAREGVAGIIRGDVSQSSTAVKTAAHARLNAGARLLDDYDALSSLAVRGAARQTWPERFHRRPDETLPTWRDRLYQSYRIPHVLAALTDLKLPYVEVVNPMLTRPVVEVVRGLPDDARTGKRLFKEHVVDRSPDVPVAERGATPSYETIFGADHVVGYLREALDTAAARDRVGSAVVDWTLESMGPRSSDGRDTAPAATEWPSVLDALKFRVASAMPTAVTSAVASRLPVRAPSLAIDPNHLAFRLFIAVSMLDRLERDAARLSAR